MRTSLKFNQPAVQGRPAEKKPDEQKLRDNAFSPIQQEKSDDTHQPDQTNDNRGSVQVAFRH
jgi:hypothetical protein